jgi:hypothetical protein
MGRAKAWAMEQEEQGFYSNNTRACTRCIEDYASRDYIKQEGETGSQCSYCNTKAQGKKLSHLTILSNAFWTALRRNGATLTTRALLGSMDGLVMFKIATTC